MLIAIIVVQAIVMAVLSYKYVVSKDVALTNFHNITHQHYLRKARNITQDMVIFIGSSSIQALVVSDIVPNGLNLGIGGEKMAGLTNRLKNYNINQSVSMVVIAAGFNDLCHSTLTEQKEMFRELIDSVADIPVVISAMQPATSQNLCEDLSFRISNYNKFLSDTCTSMDYCRFVDLPDLLRANTEKYFERDGVHLNALGYAAWSEALKLSIESLSKVTHQ
jgi:lysophospholipase L1-like esterase